MTWRKLLGLSMPFDSIQIWNGKVFLLTNQELSFTWGPVVGAHRWKWNGAVWGWKCSKDLPHELSCCFIEKENLNIQCALSRCDALSAYCLLYVKCWILHKVDNLVLFKWLTGSENKATHFWRNKAGVLYLYSTNTSETAGSYTEDINL